MSGRRTNAALLVALVAAAVTGLAAFAIGVPAGRVVVVAHGAAGVAVVVLTPWKQTIVRRGLRRRRGARWVGIALFVAVVTAVLTGVAHAAGGGPLGGVTAMQAHVGAGVVAVAVAAWHVAVRPLRLRRADLGRRDVVRAGLVAGAATAGWAALEVAYRAGGAPPRRFTGSHERGTDDPARMPVTQWLFDDVPTIDPATWRLHVTDAGGARRLALDDLHAVAPVRWRAVLDCTGGWYAAQTWSGVPLLALIDPGGARRLVVTSATGYARAFPAAAAADLLLAVAVADAPLSRGHGAPARLVAPGHRGLWWVKWVTDITVDDRPPWLQPPFPVQ